MSVPGQRLCIMHSQGHFAEDTPTQAHCSNAPTPQPKTAPPRYFLLTSPTQDYCGIIGHMRFGAGLNKGQADGRGMAPWARTGNTFQEQWGKSRLRSWRDSNSTGKDEKGSRPEAGPQGRPLHQLPRHHSPFRPLAGSSGSHCSV